MHCAGCIVLDVCDSIHSFYGIPLCIVSCSLNGWIFRYMYTSLHKVIIFMYLDSCFSHESHNRPESKPGIKAASRLAIYVCILVLAHHKVKIFGRDLFPIQSIECSLQPEWNRLFHSILCLESILYSCVKTKI